MDIYVGNIARIVTEKDLEILFGKFGTVEKVNLLKEGSSGLAKGWGFISIKEEEAAKRAIEKLNLRDFKGKKLKVTPYKPKERPKFGEWRP
jgi:RNA recognition motif-containing protein